MALIPGINSAEKRLIETMPRVLDHGLSETRAFSRKTDGCPIPIFHTDDPDVCGDIRTNRH